MTEPMVNGEDTSDVHGSEEHSNALGVPSSSTNILTEAIPDGQSIIPSGDEEEYGGGVSSSSESVTEAIPDPIVTKAGEEILLGDGEAPAQLHLIVADPAAMAAHAQLYFDIDAGLLGHPLRRSEVFIIGDIAAVAAPAQLYFDIDAGLLGDPLRRSEVGSFF